MWKQRNNKKKRNEDTTTTSISISTSINGGKKHFCPRCHQNIVETSDHLLQCHDNDSFYLEMGRHMMYKFNKHIKR